MSQQIGEFPERIDVFPLPDLVPAGDRPAAVLFIDVLRATTTVTAARAAGAEKVIPVMEPDQALQMKRLLEKSDPAKKGSLLLGGERKGVRIEGFDLGNSPADYTPERVAGKTILFSTTNGTRAILTFERNSGQNSERGEGELPRRGGPSLRQSAPPLPAAPRTRSLWGSVRSARALAGRLRAFPTLGIVCAGTDLHYTEEDILLAGLLVSRLLRPWETGGESRPRPLLNVQAETAKYLWESFLESVTPETLEKRLYEKLLASRGGENLRRIHLTEDIRDAARLDTLETVPEYTFGTIAPAAEPGSAPGKES